MVHQVAHKKLSRNTNARRALLKNLAADLLSTKTIALKPFIKKLITRAKDDSQISRRYLLAKLPRENAVKKLLELYGPVFKERPGGYTRIIKLAPRVGDRAEMALIEFVEKVSEAAAKRKLGTKMPKEELKVKEKKAETKQTSKRQKAPKAKRTKSGETSKKNVTK
jgi:large subunit ribosomal protein L17